MTVDIGTDHDWSDPGCKERRETKVEGGARVDQIRAQEEEGYPYGGLKVKHDRTLPPKTFFGASLRRGGFDKRVFFYNKSGCMVADPPIMATDAPIMATDSTIILHHY